MLNKIKLSHFRQHIDREFVFGPGMNAVRGEVEAGKSTLLEALFYFLFGVRALKESLEDIVTYHHPVGKLRVDCEIEHLGVVYTGYRGKSGAEVSFGNEKVTGQSEVTRFFEQLLGVDAKMAGKLMFASQKALAQSLAAGPTEAGQMIESLANLDVLDDVVAAIQATRPNGATTGVEARLAQLRGQAGDEPEAVDFAALEREADNADRAVAHAASLVQGARDKIEALDVAAARAAHARACALDRTLATDQAALTDLDVLLTQPLPVAPTGEELTAARAAVEAEKTINQARRVRAGLEKVDTTMLWDEPLAALDAEIERVNEAREPLRARQKGISTNLGQLSLQITQQEAETRVAVTKLEGQLIKESTCSLCQKDLKDVPEVVRINSSISKEIDAARAAGGSSVAVLRASAVELEEEAAKLVEELFNLDQEANILAHVAKVNQKVELAYAQAGALIEIDRSVVPGRWTWVGPDTSAGARPDVAGALVLLENKQRAADRAQAVRQEQQAQRVKLVARLDATKAELASLDTDAAQATLDQAEQLNAQLEPARAAHLEASRAAQQLRSNLEMKQALHEQQARQRAQLQDQIKSTEEELAAMQKYNALIKKVRAARPVITDKLWNIVLAGASKHFTDVRGTPSQITRDDGRFKCNGFPVSGLSGSAEDMLGLAMRITLARTFLPGVDLLQLDEPGAACSDARETAMLGMLSTLGYGQVIIISHNDLVDSFCDRIILV